MLTRLTIKGFQKHQQLIVDLDPSITVLTGPSDRGKSAIIRALRWLCLNRAPKKHINWHKEYAFVKLEVDGHTIIRKQGEGVNCYILDGEKLKSFKRGVPDQIKNILNVSNLNFQRQHESHFWLSLPPPKVSKELNQIVDLGIIDRSLSNIASKVKRTKLSVELTEDRIKDARRKRKELAWTIACNEKLMEIERRDATITEIRSQIEGLASSIMAMETHTAIIQDANMMIPRVKRVVLFAENADRTQKRIEQLQQVVDNIETIQEDLCRNNQQTAEVRRRLAKVKTCPVCSQPIQSLSSAQIST